MTTTANTSVVQGTAYTWDTEAGTWGDLDPSIMSYDSAFINTWTNAIGETFATAEGRTHAATKGSAEGFHVADIVINLPGHLSPEAVNFSVANNRLTSSLQQVTELIHFAEGQSRAVQPVAKSESFQVGRGSFSAPNKTIAEAAHITENYMQVSSFARNFVEYFDMIYSDSKTYSAPKNESLHLIGAILRNAEAIYQDLLVRTVALSAPELLAMVQWDGPYGYAELMPFVSGDYAYQKALFEFAIASSTVAYEPTLQDVTVTVDVPTLVQSGTVTVPHGGTTAVTFTKKYTLPPDVVLQQLNGEAVAQGTLVGTATKDGFTCALSNGGGSYLSGTIVWTAVGR